MLEWLTHFFSSYNCFVPEIPVINISFSHEMSLTKIIGHSKYLEHGVTIKSLFCYFYDVGKLIKLVVFIYIH